MSHRHDCGDVGPRCDCCVSCGKSSYLLRQKLGAYDTQNREVDVLDIFTRYYPGTVFGLPGLISCVLYYMTTDARS